MYDFLKHAHSGLRWLVLALLIASIANALSRRNSGVAFADSTRKVALFGLIACHIQLLIGLVLYFTGPAMQAFKQEGFMKISELRFIAIEHIATMILGIVLITVGFSRTKRLQDEAAKFKSIWLWYSIGLVLILSRIPWPFQNYGAGWF